MEDIKFRQVEFLDMPVFDDGCTLLNVNDEYVLTDTGILIDHSGNFIWRAKLEHYFSKAVYIKEKELLVTDRRVFLGMGGERKLGVTCIDMKTGTYKWKHFYDTRISKLNLRNRNPDINMVNNIGNVDIIKGCIYCDDFKVNLDDGYYEYIGTRKNERNEHYGGIRSKIIETLGEKISQYSINSEGIQVDVDVIYLDGQKFSKKGCFFNKCNFCIPFNDNIYFFGVPAKKNLKNAILFKYSKIEKRVIEEIELPFRNAPVCAYDFFGKGTLLILKNSIWLVECL